MGSYFPRPDISDYPETQDILNTISSNKVVIYSKTTCSFCKDAKNIFKKMNVEAHVVELDQRSDGATLQVILGHMTDANTVPRVFVNGKCIGGASQTQALYKDGTLAQMISS